MIKHNDFNRGVKQLISGTFVTLLGTILLLFSLLFDDGFLQYLSAGMLTLSTGSLLGGLYNTWKGLKNSE